MEVLEKLKAYSPKNVSRLQRTVEEKDKEIGQLRIAVNYLESRINMIINRTEFHELGGEG